MIKAIFFDLDGVITTEKSGTVFTCKNVHKATGLPFERIKDAYLARKTEFNKGELTIDEFWRAMCERLGKTFEIHLLYDALRGTQFNEPVFELSQKLRGKYKVGIISNNPRERFELISKDLKLNEKFDGIFISYMIGSLKNERKIFEFALKAFGYKPEECVFTDNSKENLEIPIEMGFKTIYFNDEKNDVNRLKEDLRLSGVELI
jgi:HAD superfamily hydrolase (TIGR01509 family)